MQRTLLFMAIVLFAAPGHATDDLRGSLTLSGAWAIYPTAVAWAEVFQKKHPGVKIDVSAGGAGKGAADAIAGLADIGMVSREPDPAELDKDIQAVYILKDAVFPIVSERNFYLLELLKRGIKRQILTDIYLAAPPIRWGQVVGVQPDKPVHVYTRSDSAGAAASWAAYLGGRQEDLRGVGIYGDPGLLEAVKRDPLGIGYNNFSYVFTQDGPPLAGIKVIAIDVNENGRADVDEVFENRTQAIAAIAEGRYPVTRKNYFFIKKNAGPLVGAFIRFALSEEGSEIVTKVGASLPILLEERAEVLELLP